MCVRELPVDWLVMWHAKTGTTVLRSPGAQSRIKRPTHLAGNHWSLTYAGLGAGPRLSDQGLEREVPDDRYV